MKSKYKVTSIQRTADGHKRISLTKPIAGKVRLMIANQTHYRDSLEDARWLAHSIAQQIFLKRQQKRNSPFHSTEDDRTWVEYRMVIEDIPLSEMPEVGSLEHECICMELMEKYRQGKGPKVIIERYTQGRQVQGYEKGQAGRPESNRRKF